MKPHILVLGAAGKTGYLTTTYLLEKGYQVRAFIRQQDHRSASLQKMGAEVFCGSLNSLSDLQTALNGIDRAYFVAPWEPEQLHMAMNFAVAASQSPSLQSIVAITQWLSSPHHPSIATRNSYITDQIFELLPNISRTVINVGWFADNYLPEAIIGLVSQLGLFPYPLKEGKTAPISNRDIARVIVSCLEAPDLHDGKVYRPTGPCLMTPEDIANSLSAVTKRPVRYMSISDHMFFKALRMMNMPLHMQMQLQHYIKDYQQGAFERGAPNQIVEQLTGVAAEPFEVIAKRYINRSSFRHRTYTNALHALGTFLKLVMTPAYDLGTLEQKSDCARIKNSKYALESEMWRAHHA